MYRLVYLFAGLDKTILFIIPLRVNAARTLAFQFFFCGKILQLKLGHRMSKEAVDEFEFFNQTGQERFYICYLEFLLIR